MSGTLLLHVFKLFERKTYYNHTHMIFIIFYRDYLVELEHTYNCGYHITEDHLLMPSLEIA